MGPNKILASSPYVEVIIRNIYWRCSPLVKWFNKRKKVKQISLPQTSAGKFVNYLSSQGIGKGSLLIVHSSFAALRAENEKPEQVIDKLLELLGPEGTLAMPAIPFLKGQPDVTQSLYKDVSDLILDYDPLTSPVSTGALPSAMCKYSGAVRSLHPLNTMVAIGPLAAPMMENNIAGYKPLPCGTKSPWYFCYLKDATIVAIGVDMADTLTMVHVAEDMWGENWVVPNWHRERKFRIYSDGNPQLITVRERHPRWGALHLAYRTKSRDLTAEGIIKKTEIDGVNVEIISAKALVDYLNSRNHTGYPYFLVPIKKNQKVLEIT